MKRIHTPPGALAVAPVCRPQCQRDVTAAAYQEWRDQPDAFQAREHRHCANSCGCRSIEQPQAA
jgi:hypothetical protein